LKYTNTFCFENNALCSDSKHLIEQESPADANVSALRATAVHVWRHLAKKSIQHVNDMRFPIAGE